MKEEYREVKVLGAACYTDTYICSSDDHIYMMSLFGRSGTVKAICAMIIAGNTVDIFSDGKRCRVKRSYMNYRIYTCNYEGLCHKIIMVETLFAGEDGAMIIARDDKERIFNFIDSRVSTPLKPEWADWLIKQDIINHELLCSFNGAGKMGEEYCMFHSPNSEATDEVILKGIKDGDIK